MFSVPDSPRFSLSDAARLRTRAAGVAMAIGLTTGAIAVTLVADDAGAADIVYVSPAGDDTASGRVDDPVRTIARAVQVADAGDTIEIDAGVYHEEVQVYAKEVHLRPAPAADVVLDGARPIDGWTAAPGGWAAPWTTDFDRVEAPFTTPERPEAGWPEQFFFDGAPLVEVTSADSLEPGEFYYDTTAGQVVIADDPAGHRVEGSALAWGLYLNEAHGSSVHGITVRRYATQTRNMAAIRAYADDLTITDVTAELNARIGVSAMGNRISLTEVRATDNGHLGVHGHRSSDLSLVGVTATGNNRERFDAKHSAGGIKVTDTDRLLVRSTIASDNAGPGIWTDLDVTDSIVVSSVAERNGRSGIEIELSERVVVADNVVTDNGEAGIWVLESSGVDVWHNTVLHNVRDIWVEDGDRRDLVGVTVSSNVLGGGADGAEAILNVDDWTERRSAVDMRVSVDANLYWLNPSSPTTFVSRWANWPEPLALSSNIDEHRDATDQGGASTVIEADTNPFARDVGDVRLASSATPAPRMPLHVAAAIGVTEVYPAGAITPDDDGQIEAPPSPVDPVDPVQTSAPISSPVETERDEEKVEPRSSSTPEGIERARIGRAAVDAETTQIEPSPDDVSVAPSNSPVAPVSTATGTAEPVGRHEASDDTAHARRRAGWSALRDEVAAALDAIAKP